MTLISPEAFDLDNVFDSADDDPLERDRPWGRPLLLPTPARKRNPLVRPPRNRKPHPKGKLPYTRASSLSDYVTDHTGLETWRMQSAIKGLGEREDLAAQAAALPPILSNTRDKSTLTKEELAQDRATKAELNRIAEEAMIHANRDYKAHWGTAVHTFTDPGPHGQVPARMQSDVESWFAATRGWIFHGTEIFVANDVYQSAGTFDHVVEIPWRPDLGRIVIDKKTGMLHPEQLPVQLSVYARGKPYNPHTDQREDWPDGITPNQKWGLTAHIPMGLGRTDLYLVDLEKGHKAALLACAVRKHRSEAEIEAVDFTAGRDTHVAGLVAVADCKETLLAIHSEWAWCWSDDLTALGTQRLAQLAAAA